MTNPRFASCATLCKVVLIATSLLNSSCEASKFLFDTAKDCESKKESCRTSETTWFECPMTCSLSLQTTVPVIHGRTSDGDAFFELKAKTISGSIVHFDRLEGLVTLIALIPQYPGMAPFYYELMEDFAHRYPYTISVIIIPLSITSSSDDDDADDTSINTDFRLKEDTSTKTILLEKLVDSASSSSSSNSLIAFLENVEHSTPNAPALDRTKVSIYVVSHDGWFIDRLTTPTQESVETFVKQYLKRLQQEL